MDARILVIGSSNIDFVLKTSYVPAAGETLVTDGSYGFVPGGKGANAAVAAAKLGGQSILCSRVGDDAYGDRLLQILSESCVDRRFVKVDETEQTGLAAVMVEKGGNNRIIVYSGANRNIGESDIENAMRCYPDIVMANLEISGMAAEFLSRYAQVKGYPLVLDCGGVSRSFDLRKIKKIEILSPNENETQILTGIHPDSLDDCLKACMALYAMTDIKYIVLKLGARGSFIYDGKYCDICGPYEVEAVDTTAAGDAFTAALTLEYYRNGGDIRNACRYGNAVGALTVTKPGALTSLPSKEEVELFMETHSQT